MLILSTTSRSIFLLTMVLFIMVVFIINSGIEGDLVACVAMSPAVREKLGPALLHTYCSVDIVEGLDVDKEEFDKFSAR